MIAGAGPIPATGGSQAADWIAAGTSAAAAIGTLMAYQTNLLIMSAAGYTFRDYLRVGTPLAVLMVITLSILLVRHYGL